MNPQLMRIPAAAAALAIGRTTLYELLAAGEIRAVKIGARGVRVPVSEVERFIRERMDTNEAGALRNAPAQEDRNGAATPHRPRS